MGYNEGDRGKSMTPSEYLDAAKEKLGIESDYELAKRLDIGRSAISDYRHGRRSPDDYAAFRLAVILEKDPAEIVADLAGQTEKDQKKAAFFRDFASRVSGTGRKAAHMLGWIFIAAWLAGAAVTGSNAGGVFKRRVSCA